MHYCPKHGNHDEILCLQCLFDKKPDFITHILEQERRRWQEQELWREQRRKQEAERYHAITTGFLLGYQ